MRQFAAYIRARAAFKLFMFERYLIYICSLMYYNTYSNSFNGGLTAVIGARTQEPGGWGDSGGSCPPNFETVWVLPPNFHRRIFFSFLCSYNSYQCDINYEDVRQQL